MVQKDQTMLELVAHPQLRTRMLSSEAAILFRADMKRVIWANSPGTDLLGGGSVWELSSADLSPQQPFIRQVLGAAQQVSPDHPVVRGFRTSRGKRVDFIQCELSHFPLPGGESAILLTCDDDTLMRAVREHEHAALVLHSLAGVADIAAITDEFGLIVAASDKFLDVEFSEDTLPRLVRDVNRTDDQNREQHISELDGGSFSFKTIKLDSQPPRFLITCRADEAVSAEDTPRNHAVNSSVIESDTVPDADVSAVVADTASHDETDAPTIPTQEPSATEPEMGKIGREAEPVTAKPLERRPSSVRSLLDRWYSRQTDVEMSDASAPRPGDVPASRIAPSAPERHGGNKGNDQPADKDNHVGETADGSAKRYAETATSSAGEQVASGLRDEVSEKDKTEKSKIDPTKEIPNDPFRFTAQGEAVRFAWTIDSAGVFRSVSPELAKTVGPNAADIVGRSWREVATVFGFDRSEEISRLLEKRDTWSGKTVMWPVQGTELALPVDLAALPAFGQSREFDGFRGFGIIRTADAAFDHEELGRALTSNPASGVAAEPNESAKQSEDVRRQQSPFENDDGKVASAPKSGSISGEARETGAKIVDMNTRRARETAELPSADERLSGREVRAFREIGEKLGSDTNIDSATNEDSFNEIHGKQQGDAQDKPQSDAADEPATANHGKARKSPAAAAPKPDNHGAKISGQGEILEQLPVPVLVYRNGETLFANTELLEATGYGSVSEISEVGGVAALISVEKMDEGENAVMSLTRKDGSTLKVSPLLKTVPWDEEKALLLTFKRPAGDAHERAVIDLVRVSELENILDTATDGIIITESDGRIESLNASGEALFGISFDDARGSLVTGIFAEESQKTIEDYMAEISQPGVAGILNDGREVIGREVNGGLIPLFITIGKLGESQKYCIVLRDITQWKKAEEELVTAKREAESASEQKTEFLARVSHEIRTPLNAIIGFSDVMIEERFGPIDNDRYREYLRDINRSGVHVLDLINDLLDISKIEAGKMELSYEAVDLNQLVSETVALLQPQANGERIIIRTSLSRAVPRVVADVRSVRQVILNLVSNAIKFTSANGQVIVSTVYESNGEVVLRVRDTGRGMSASEIEHAMKPFSQINVTDENRGRGTGLGLPLTKALVEANRAYFDLESKPGEGTIALVHFPTQRVLAD